MKLFNPYLYIAAQPHSQNSGLNAKKIRNLTLLDAQLRNLTLAVPHFSCKTNLLHPQEGHLLRQIALSTQRGHANGVLSTLDVQMKREMPMP